MCYCRCCKFSVTPPSGDIVSVTVVDDMDNTVVANTTVALGGDITSWLNSLIIPTHDGYEFDKWVITAGYIYSVNDNATVYIMYRTAGGGQGGSSGNNPSGDTPKVITYVNGDGDITVDAIHSGWDFTGSAQIAIQMSKTFDSVEYESYDIREFNTADSENRDKTDAAISGDIITFTDEKIDTHNYYRIGLFDSSGNRVGQTAWDAGFKPIKITVTVDGTNHEYDIVSNWH